MVNPIYVWTGGIRVFLNLTDLSDTALELILSDYLPEIIQIWNDLD